MQRRQAESFLQRILLAPAEPSILSAACKIGPLTPSMIHDPFLIKRKHLEQIPAKKNLDPYLTSATADLPSTNSVARVAR